jgi:beta-lactamase superfamily II metal-dependent hydrolase
MERARNHLYKNLLTYFLLAIFSLGYTAWSSYQSEKVEKGSGFLKFVVLDIGQGDALYIESPCAGKRKRGCWLCRCRYGE